MNNITNPVLYKIWEDRYQKNNESLDENYHRVAKYIAKNEEEEQMFYSVISEGLFLPAGRTMSNAGIGTSLTMNNCFVAPQIKDDLSEIFNTVKLGAITHKNGGGIGYDFSALRPKNTPTSNDAVASGPISFMEVFDAQTDTILQGNRRGANMGVLNIYHPDIEDFITVKSSTGKLTHFNLSVMVDDEFMEAVNNKSNIVLHFPVYDADGHILKDESKWIISKEVSAEDLWNKIMLFAYDNGEPGIFFYDNMNRVNNLWYCENIVCSNPCSEYLAGTVFDDGHPEIYGGACNLGSLMLPNFVVNPFMKNAYVDINSLREVIDVAVRMLDNIIDVNKFPNEIYRNYQYRFRTIGLGVTGLGDLLAMLNMRYDSQEARNYVDSLMGMITNMAYYSSCMLAKERGRFPGWDNKFLDSKFLEENIDESTMYLIQEYGMRNAKILAVAPTGTMSLTFGNNCSSGIEPIFSLEYDRKVKIGGQQDENIQVIKMRDYAYEKWLEVKDNPDCVVSEDVFVTALNISVNDHVDMLANIAKHIDMSVSKTINVPENYSFENTKDIYMRCWESGIKGCTIFRPNAIRQGILITENEEHKVEHKLKSLDRGEWEAKPEDTIYYERKLKIGCGKLIMFVGWSESEQKIVDLFIKKNGQGGCEKLLETAAICMSAILRLGGGVNNIEKALRGVSSCPSFVSARKDGKKLSKGNHCGAAIVNELNAFYKEKAEKPVEKNVDVTEKKEVVSTKNSEAAGAKCPECGEVLVFEGGCVCCKSCGWSRCS